MSNPVKAVFLAQLRLPAFRYDEELENGEIEERVQFYLENGIEISMSVEQWKEEKIAFLQNQIERVECGCDEFDDEEIDEEYENSLL